MKKSVKNKINPSLHRRSAGVLLHITSLPSDYGIGDLGPEAIKFADFLHRTRQTYWQLLPLNPTEQSKGHSPYSAISSIAGNPLVISPDLLVSSGWLSAREADAHKLPAGETVDFDKVENIKETLFAQAFRNFLKSKSTRRQAPFDEFCRREKTWLDDFALYVILKQDHGQKPWYAWADPYKMRDAKTLNHYSRKNEERLKKVKWLQYIFFTQWRALKQYCNNKGIQLFGDLPFYVSYDSADVWSFPEIFSLDKKRRIQQVAGVPPDYFNANGQLWGMPVFKWDVLKRQRYAWWVHRIRKNMELYDVLRLDHFRAFADFWSVPAHEETAINGQWKRGPGKLLFDELKRKIGYLPFVAEDLGDINDAVYKLRDQYDLPGMKVLHFAFGENMATSTYIPHNYTQHYVVYAGTHDNNTSRGWFRKDATKTERKNLETYFAGQKVTAQNIHVKLIQLAYASVAETAIITVQDLLGLDEPARMNTPASTAGNWSWRMLPGAITATLEDWLEQQVRCYNRAP